MVAQSTTVTLGYQVKPGLPTWLGGKVSVCRCRRCGFGPWVRKIPQRRKWQPTQVFLPEKSPLTEESNRLWSMGSQRVGNDSATEDTHTKSN